MIGKLIRKLIPQALVRYVCARRGHCERQYVGRVEQRVLVVRTCLCGDVQSANHYDVRHPRPHG